MIRRCPLIAVAGVLLLALGPADVAAPAGEAPSAAEAALPEGPGLAAEYPGDRGIEDDPRVVFAENFATGTLEQVRDRWGFARHLDAMTLTEDVPEGSATGRSLRMTATRRQQGVELYKTFDEGWERVFLRFDVRFDPDYGINHHFVALRGFKNPTRWPPGGAGRRPDNHFSVTIEPTLRSINRWPDPPDYAPPGTWMFYAYWPRMRSWQTVDGRPDGRPNPYYGNGFMPADPAPAIERGRWHSVEVMLQLNSRPDADDGELALWVDGRRAAHFAPGTPHGYFIRDQFRHDPDHERARPFPGFRWRHDMDVKINVLRLQNYVSERVFDQTARLAREHPQLEINTERASVSFTNIVLATSYIGPMAPLQEPQPEED